MSIRRVNRLPRNRPPTSPGEMLREVFLKPMKMTQHDLADASGLSVSTIRDIIHGKQKINVHTATELGLVFGTTAGLWLRLQDQWDAWQTFHPKRTRTPRPARTSRQDQAKP